MDQESNTPEPTQESLYETLKADLTKEITEEVKKEVHSEVKASLSKGSFAQPKAEKHAEWDKNEYFLNLALTGMKNVNPTVKEQAQNLLSNKYGRFNQEEKTIVSSSTTSGGAFIPELFAEDLVVYQNMANVLYGSGATQYDLGKGKSIQVPVINQTAGYGAGLSAGAPTEGATYTTKTEPTLAQLEIVGDIRRCLVPISNDTINNSPMSIAQIVADFTKQFLSDELDDYCFNGNASNFTGFIGHSGTVKVNRKTANKIVWQDIARMYARVVPSLLQQYVWAVTPEGMGSLLEAEDTSGRLVWISNGTDEPRLSILGRPVFVTDKCSALGEEGDIALIARSEYRVGVRRGIEVTASEHLLFGDDVTVLKVQSFAGGKPPRANPVVGRNSFEQSAFITLDDLASG